MSDTHLLVQTTCPDIESARELAATLLDLGLASCINLVPGIESHYNWEGERKSGTEILLLIKTAAQSYGALQNAITDNHPYELPEVIAVPINAGLPAYLQWVSDSVTTSTDPVTDTSQR